MRLDGNGLRFELMLNKSRLATPWSGGKHADGTIWVVGSGTCCLILQVATWASKRAEPSRAECVDNV